MSHVSLGSEPVALQDLVSHTKRNPLEVLDSVEAWLSSGKRTQVSSSDVDTLSTILGRIVGHCITHGEILLKLYGLMKCISTKFPHLRASMLNCVGPSLLRILVADSKFYSLKDGPKLAKFRFEITKFLNSLLSKIPLEHRSRLRDEHGRYFNSIPRLMGSVGDIDAQFHLTELLYRVCDDRTERESFGKQWFKGRGVDQFVKITKSAFEVDCRIFLNIFNQSYGSKATVHTYGCEEILVGKRSVKKPRDHEYKRLWVDFNEGTKSILVFCSNASDSSCWDACCIEVDDINQAKITKDVKKGLQTLHIQLLKDAYLLFDSSSVTEFPGVDVKMTFTEDVPLASTLITMFGDKVLTEDGERMAVPNSSQSSEDVVAASQLTAPSMFHSAQKIPLSCRRGDSAVTVAAKLVKPLPTKLNKRTTDCSADKTCRNAVVARVQVITASAKAQPVDPASLPRSSKNHAAQKKTAELMLDMPDKVIEKPSKIPKKVFKQRPDEDDANAAKSPEPSNPSSQQDRKDANAETKAKEQSSVNDPSSERNLEPAGKASKHELKVPSFAEAHQIAEPKIFKRKKQQSKRAAAQTAKVDPGLKDAIRNQPVGEEGKSKDLADKPAAEPAAKPKDLGQGDGKGGRPSSTVQNRSLRKRKCVNYVDSDDSDAALSDAKNSRKDEPHHTIYSDFLNTESDEAVEWGFRKWRESKVNTYERSVTSKVPPPAGKQLEKNRKKTKSVAGRKRAKQHPGFLNFSSDDTGHEAFGEDTRKFLTSTRKKEAATGKMADKKAKDVSAFGFSSEDSGHEALRDDPHNLKAAIEIGESDFEASPPAKTSSKVAVSSHDEIAKTVRSPRVILQHIDTPKTRLKQTPATKTGLASHVKKQLFPGKRDKAHRGTVEPPAAATSPARDVSHTTCTPASCPCFFKVLASSSCFRNMLEEMVAKEVKNQNANAAH